MLSGFETVIRDNIEAFVQFLQEAHPTHFLIWSLEEREYNRARFQHQVGNILLSFNQLG